MAAKLTLCVPVLRRYDLLRRMVQSLRYGSIYPDRVIILDNGRSPSKLWPVVEEVLCEVVVITPRENLGVAASWNRFIIETSEERIITNDDVYFSPQSLADMIASPGPIVTSIRGNAFSCFLYRDEAVTRLGLFDETISPGYAYFEDCDMEERMGLANVSLVHCECGVIHDRSSTLAAATPEERDEHHRRFVRARDNFVAKWGRLPQGL